MEKLVLSPLSKTWILDLDGTLVKHNGYLSDGDVLLDGVKEFFQKLDKNDRVIILTSRSRAFRKTTEDFLTKNDIRFDDILFDMPFGERILINDNKPSGLHMAHAVNKARDGRFSLSVDIDEKL